MRRILHGSMHNVDWLIDDRIVILHMANPTQH